MKNKKELLQWLKNNAGTVANLKKTTLNVFTGEITTDIKRITLTGKATAKAFEVEVHPETGAPYLSWVGIPESRKLVFAPYTNDFKIVYGPQLTIEIYPV